MFKFLKWYLQKVTPTPMPLPIFKVRFAYEEINDVNYNFKKFGDLNKDKAFYVIKRSPGTGMFSNVTFVLNHILVAKKLNCIPVVDMENYITIYNEKEKIHKTFNAWEYYFEQISPYSLDEVYKSEKVLITNNKFYNFFHYYLEGQELALMLINEIKIKKRIFKSYQKIHKQIKNYKTLGIHFRGTSYKRSVGHPMPATVKQMLEITKKIIKEKKVEKIFLATEELDYLKAFKSEFGEKIIYIKSCYRSNRNDAFKKYPRRLHRYKMGREIILETLLLSSCDYFVYVTSNVSNAAKALNINKNQERIEINNGINSKNIFISQFYWYIKKILPASFGGLKTKFWLD